MRDGIVIAKHKAQYTSTHNITRLVRTTIPPPVEEWRGCKSSSSGISICR
jgi:hypothetical protein